METRKKIGIILIALSVWISYSYITHLYNLNSTYATSIEIPEMREKRGLVWGKKNFTDADEHCLALNIYFETRGEKSVRGKYAVADVVMYRYLNDEYPNAVCNIVKDGQYSRWRQHVPVRNKCQFSWWCDGKPDVPKDDQAFERATEIAKEVLHDPHYVPRIEYAIHYHANYVRPRWARTKEFVASIGNHRFYR